MKNWYIYLKKIHLYACLTTVAVFLMFILTSYMMIHHKWLDRGEGEKINQSITVSPDDLEAQNWGEFLKNHQVKGVMTREYENQQGDLVREYNSAAVFSKLTIPLDGQEIKLEQNIDNTYHAIIGIHRQRSYNGPWQYQVYALLLDLMAISLIIFAITGVWMWMKLLKNNKTAWIVFIAGGLYFLAIILSLMFG